jgi:CBS domain-containing protein
MIKNCMKRVVVSIPESATIREAALRMAKHHIGLLPVVDVTGRLIGVIGLPELLSLELPAFFDLIADLDFVSDFGAVESSHPSAEEIDQPVTTLMQPAQSVEEDSGSLRAYGLMLKHNLSDLPVVSDEGMLVGVVSRVDIGAAILATWQEIGTLQP